MANKSRHTFKKNEREKDRRTKRMQKEARKLEAKKIKAEAEPYSGEGDPDIAGIVPGPQPRLDEE
jgi:hypothetical protein